MATKKRLIDANALMERLKFKKKVSEVGLYRGLESAMAQCQKATTVDAVEVVRCKDCKFWEEAYGSDGMLGYCINAAEVGVHTIWYPDDFCSYGERKDNER